MLNQKAAREKSWQSTQPEKTGEMGSFLDELETQQVRIADRMNPDPVGITQCAGHTMTRLRSWTPPGTSSSSLDLSDRLLLQPFPLLVLPTTHFSVPASGRFSVQFKLFLFVSTELGISSPL